MTTPPEPEIKDDWRLYDLAEIDVVRSGGYWRVREYSRLSGRTYSLGPGHRFRWRALREARQTQPIYYPRERS